MATYSWPANIYPSQVAWRLIANSQGFVSPLSGVEQTVELPGARWQATLRFEQLKRAEIAALEALVFKLRGKANRVLLPDHFRSTPRGSASGTPLVAGAGQTGNTLNTDGWTPSQTGILLAGDRIAVNGEFKALTADADSDVTGAATLTFEPPLRAAPADNAALTVSAATCKMMLVDTSQGQFDTRRALTATSLTFIEDIA